MGAPLSQLPPGLIAFRWHLHARECAISLCPFTPPPAGKTDQGLQRLVILGAKSVMPCWLPPGGGLRLGGLAGHCFPLFFPTPSLLPPRLGPFYRRPPPPPPPDPPIPPPPIPIPPPLPPPIPPPPLPPSLPPPPPPPPLPPPPPPIPPPPLPPPLPPPPSPPLPPPPLSPTSPGRPSQSPRLAGQTSVSVPFRR